MHAKRLKTVLIFCLLLFSTSCRDKKNIERLEQRLKELSVTIPKDSLLLLEPTSYKSDYLVPVEIPDLRYIVYYDSENCATCKLNLLRIWCSVIKNSHEIGANIDFEFIFHPKSHAIEDFKSKFYDQYIPVHVYLDTTGVIERMNPFLKESSVFHRFVLNRENRIEVIGDAGNSLKEESKFYEYLRKYVQQESAQKCNVASPANIVHP